MRWNKGCPYLLEPADIHAITYLAFLKFLFKYLSLSLPLCRRACRDGSRNLIRLWYENIFPSVPNKNYISILKHDKQWEEVTKLKKQIYSKIELAKRKIYSKLLHNDIYIYLAKMSKQVLWNRLLHQTTNYCEKKVYK